ncbi:integrase arm-type DNA-binding domain-containing protein [Oxalobacter sp. OttesenSCG-928-P03]|nr:integrase arm-type DNA-binding domain-containing protein [Oxalobacter sp. OttesenSCG-928-P03]
MARIIKPLSPVQVRNAKPKEKTYKLSDGGGLYLSVYPNGSKLWHMKVVQAGGKENRLSFGKYPDVSLEQARQHREEARKLRASGINPAQARRAQKATNKERAENNFDVVARIWHDKRTRGDNHSKPWTPGYSQKVLSRLARYVLPWIGDIPVSDIAAPDFRKVLLKIADHSSAEAIAIKTLCSQVMDYAVDMGLATGNTVPKMRDALQPPKVKHYASTTEPKQVAELLRAIDSYRGTFPVACALKIAPYVFVRPGELRTAQWADIDLDAAEWRYTVTKTDTQHIVPLARQVVDILKELRPLTGHGRYLFPSARSNDRPMSDNAILAALRRLGISKDEMTGHGFRAMARTILDEVLHVRPDLIEHQLAHAVRDPNGRAYNRTAHLPERKKMMQQWADYLDKLKAGAEVVSLRRNTA